MEPIQSHNKKFAFLLFNMTIGDSTIYNGNTFFRVPGGWLTESGFIPWDNEFQGLAFKPTENTAMLICPKCKEPFHIYIKETYQGNVYKCDYCGNEIIWEEKESDTYPTPII